MTACHKYKLQLFMECNKQPVGLPFVGIYIKYFGVSHWPKKEAHSLSLLTRSNIST